MDSPFLALLMVAGAGRECKGIRRVRGYEGTAIYWRYGEVFEWKREGASALRANAGGVRCDFGCRGVEADSGGGEEAQRDRVPQPGRTAGGDRSRPYTSPSALMSEGYEAFDDPYVYPGTSVLRNRLGIRDAAGLEGFEVEAAHFRAEEGLPGGNFDAAHYSAVASASVRGCLRVGGNVSDGADC